MVICFLPVFLSLGWGMDHSALDGVLAAQVQRNTVRYSVLAVDRAPLTAYLGVLAKADVPAMSEAEQKAFWLNAYNATTLELVASEWPLTSILSLDAGKVFETRKFWLGRELISLNGVENQRLRPLGDPRIHAALVCAARSCPPMRTAAFSADGLDAQLDDASRAWAKTTAATLERGAKKAHLSQIFEWYGEDFVPLYGGVHDIPGVEGTKEAALNFIAAFSEPDTAAWIQAGGYTVDYARYNWGINGR